LEPRRNCQPPRATLERNRAATIRDRIFDPFFTTKAAGVGTGLGLSICQRIVTGLGGEIESESEEGAGTLVRVALPIAQERDVSTPRIIEQQAEPARRALRVLVVDDEPAICRMLERVLRPHQVVAEVSALPALERLRRREDYDVLLCDLVMPGMSGVEFFQALRALRPELAPRIVFMTGGTSSPDLEEFLRSVDNRRVLKPFEVAELRQVVGSVAGGERPG
jgi:CheY-like chemotaxis protein